MASLAVRAEAIVDLADLVVAIALDLWPNGNPDAEWDADTMEAIARRLDFLRPKEGGE